MRREGGLIFQFPEARDILEKISQRRIRLEEQCPLPNCLECLLRSLLRSLLRRQLRMQLSSLLRIQLRSLLKRLECIIESETRVAFMKNLWEWSPCIKPESV